MFWDKRNTLEIFQKLNGNDHTPGALFVKIDINWHLRTSQSSNKILLLSSYLKLSSRCLEMWADMIFLVWYITKSTNVNYTTLMTVPSITQVDGFVLLHSLTTIFFQQLNPVNAVARTPCLIYPPDCYKTFRRWSRTSGRKWEKYEMHEEDNWVKG